MSLGDERSAPAPRDARQPEGGTEAEPAYEPVTESAYESAPASVTEPAYESAPASAPVTEPASAPVRGSAPVLLRGRTVVPGVAEGEALVSSETISGWGGIDPARGVIIERRHPLHGVSFAGKVLVFPGAKGSSGWAGFFQATRLLGTAPLAMVFMTMTSKAALGAVVTRVPAVTGLDRDPLTVIHTGDLVRVDADRGVVSVYPRSQSPRPRSPSATQPPPPSHPQPQ